MDQLAIEIEQHLSKIELLEEFVSLHLRKNKIAPQLKKLNEKTHEVKLLMSQSKEFIKKQADLNQNYEDVMHEMLKQQLQIINILEKSKQTREKEKESAKPKQITPKCYSVSRLPTSIQRSVMSSKTVTPKLFQQTPLGQRNFQPIPFQLLDFDAKITQEMFETIPKYMKGRETIDDLNSFLENVVIACFNEKYRLLSRNRDSIRNTNDLELWKMFREQSTYLPGKNFITQGDVSRKIKKMIDKKMHNRFVVLRHIGILQEVRKAQTVCYVWTAN